MKIIVIFFSLFTIICADENIKKVVYDLTTGDQKILEKSIIAGIVAHKNYYEEKFHELNVAVVIHGDAYKFFVKAPELTKYKNDATLIQSRETLEKRLKSLSQDYHVEFLVCAVGMKKNGLTEKHIYPFVTPVANSTVGLIDKQNEGYAYLPVR